MNAPLLRRELRPYRARHALARFWLAAQFALFGLFCALAGYALGDKLLFIGTSFHAVAAVASALCAVGLLAVLAGFRAPDARLAYLLDRRAGLKNLVASAVSDGAHAGDANRLVLDAARAALRSRSPARLLPLRMHWTGRYAVAPAALLAVALCLPSFDVLGRRRRLEAERAEREEVKLGAAAIASRLRMLESQTNRLESVETRVMAKELQTLSQALAQAGKQDALLKLGEFENRYRETFAEQKQFERAAQALHRQPPDLSRLADRDRAAMEQLARNLKEGKFGGAADALRDLADRLAGGDLTEQQRRDLARELAKLSEQLRNDSALARELSELLREIAASPADLEKLLRQCKQAGDKMGDLAEFCRACEALKAMRDGLGDAKQALLGDQFKDFDAQGVEQYMAAAAKLGGQGIGDGTGGEGQGRGGDPPEAPTATSFQPERSPGRINEGRVLQQMFVSGLPEKGDARREYAELIRAARQEAAGSLAADRVPREYEDMVKRYFDAIEPAP